LNYCACWLRYK